LGYKKFYASKLPFIFEIYNLVDSWSVFTTSSVYQLLFFIRVQKASGEGYLIDSVFIVCDNLKIAQNGYH